MEQLLHYTWKHKLWPLHPLTTTDHRDVEVIDPGLHNNNQGPDFFNAKIRINGTLWVGNVELHDRASDWYLHGHDRDQAYDNVVLHVCSVCDRDVQNSRGEFVPQMQLDIPQHVRDNYRKLLDSDKYPPCYTIIPSLSGLTIHAWMAALQTERLEQKTEAIKQRADRAAGSWEDAFFQTLARNYGFGVNGDAFELWSRQVSLTAAGKHRDNLFQVEALFLGQAGLLSPEAIPERYLEAARQDPYYKQLASEYRYLAHKFSLTAMDHRIWKFLRMRPQNFPHIRLSQLANLYHERHTNLSTLLECETVDQLRTLLATHVTPYWETHYTFGSESTSNSKRLSPFSLNLLIINTAIPTLFAVGRHRQKEALCDRAFDLLEQLKAERNHIVTMWKECGLEARTAGDSQALIQLKNNYCDRRDCLRCRFGFEYLRGTHGSQQD